MVHLINLNICILLAVMFQSVFISDKTLPGFTYAEEPVSYYNPKWSPDGSRLLFESTMDGKSSIYTISMDGRDLKKLTDTMYEYGQPAWSPDGKQIVYYGSQQPMQLFINDASGGRQKELATPGYDAYEPNWSSLQMLAFDSRKIGQVPNEISTMKSDGSSLKIITDGMHDCSSPQWSPDGKQILIEQSVAVRKKWKEITPDERIQMRDSCEIMLMNADGSGIRNLTKNKVRDIAPTWSVDGKSFFYISEEASGKIFYKQNLKGGKPEQIYKLKEGVHGVDISPDEKNLAYVADRDNKSAIYVYNIKNGSEVKVIGD